MSTCLIYLFLDWLFPPWIEHPTKAVLKGGTVVALDKTQLISISWHVHHVESPVFSVLSLHVKHANCYQLACLICMKEQWTSASNCRKFGLYIYIYPYKLDKGKNWNLGSNLVSPNRLLWSTHNEEAILVEAKNYYLPSMLYFILCQHVSCISQFRLLSSTHKAELHLVKTPTVLPPPLLVLLNKYWNPQYSNRMYQCNSWKIILFWLARTLWSVKGWVLPPSGIKTKAGPHDGDLCYAGERFTYWQIPLFFLTHALIITQWWVSPPFESWHKGKKNPWSRSQLFRWRIYILEDPFVLIYQMFDQWGVGPSPFHLQHTVLNPWSEDFALYREIHA